MLLRVGLVVGCAASRSINSPYPTEQLKALPDEETQAVYTEAVNRLFRLGDDPTTTPAPSEPDTSSLDDMQDTAGDQRNVRADRRRGE